MASNETESMCTILSLTVSFPTGAEYQCEIVHQWYHTKPVCHTNQANAFKAKEEIMFFEGR